MILALLMLCLVVGMPVAIVWARDRTRSIHHGAFLIAGLHCLASLLIGLCCVQAAWASAATGSGSGPGIMGYVLVALQFPVFLLSKVVPDMSLSTAAICLLPSSLLYGYAIAALVRGERPTYPAVVRTVVAALPVLFFLCVILWCLLSSR